MDYIEQEECDFVRIDISDLYGHKLWKGEHPLFPQCAPNICKPIDTFVVHILFTCLTPCQIL